LVEEKKNTWQAVDFDFAQGKVEIVDLSFVTDVEETAGNCYRTVLSSAINL
jgi:hypothetical protein